ncbi:predicted protein [Sclerotinia sclerotiorum 1980 UF-70]|uniref:Uncharacterized protein n=1 Tax=Sclerotinia sclerotiorum (strain ATCC 18683 / 1980 / Ss-1) TaxID=665079 RepID=A7E8V7_SCLS1|nr:predicted protein [Sclerotinia sclerotiorum 1980 UF-70]EDN96809.1 predicted protein [Sclerotinia sclerotiorum 1980 UF-70]
MTLPPYPIHLGSTQPTASYGRLQNYQTGNAPTVAQHAQPSDEHAYAKGVNKCIPGIRFSNSSPKLG